MIRRANPLLSIPLVFVTVFSLTAFHATRKATAGDCPLVFDLNGDGRISTTTKSSARGKVYSLQSLLDFVSFDIDGDGVKDRIEWIDGTGDGILVDMTKVDASGQIDGRALFGNIRAAEGFEALSGRDADGNGIIDGGELTGLKLWLDNGDAVLQEGELKDLSDYRITAVELEYDSVPGTDGAYHLVSSARTDNGSLLVEDVWFLNMRFLTPFEQVFLHTIGRLV